MSNPIRSCIACILILLAMTSAQAATLNRWVQLAPAHRVLLRAIIDGGACPAASVDGTAVTLAPRNDPASAGGAFSVTVCEAPVAVGGASAIIDGVRLKMPVTDPRRIVVIGDTGCRVLPGLAQACNDPSVHGFPLARLAQIVGAFDPDLIVHVGDYYYREAACPAGNDGCAGTPYGDTWAAWNADWFTPAQALLQAAPLALSRGNHESCGRGAKGWFTLLDPRPYEAAAVACAFGSPYDYPPSYVVDAGAVALIMWDSSYANTSRKDSLLGDSSFRAVEALTATAYAPDIKRQLQSIGDKPALLVTHRPAYGVVRPGPRDDATRLFGGAPDEQALFADGVPAQVKGLIAGHIHQFEAVQLRDARFAPQLIVGMGGTYLDDPATDAVTTSGGLYPLASGDMQSVAAMTDIAGEFGFAVLDRTEDGFTANLYFLDGVPHGACVLRITGARGVTCSP